MDEDEEPHKSLHIFGRDIAQIPCFRSSFLYGIGGGIGCGILTFLGTSRTKLATNAGFGTFFCGTLCFWFYCRYDWSKKRFEYSRLQAAMRKQVMYEGTAKEEEIKRLQKLEEEA